MPSSRFWGVSWDSSKGKWQACYTARDGRTIKIGRFDDEEAAALAVNKATRDAGLEGERNMNAIDAAGKPMPKPPGRFNPTPKADKSHVVQPDPTVKYRGVSWHARNRRWQAYYNPSPGKTVFINFFDTPEEAALAVNAAIRRAGREGQCSLNPVDETGLPVPYRGKRRSGAVAPAAASPPPPNCMICLDPTTVTLTCDHAMCEECMKNLALSKNQHPTRSCRYVIHCPMRCEVWTERVLA